VEAWQAGYDRRVGELGPKPRRLALFGAWHDLTARPSLVMVWTPEQVGMFLDAVADHRLYPLFHLIAFRGLRRGEACGLRWQDTDLEAGTVSIETQLVQASWEVQEDSPKTSASDATIPLGPEVADVLRAWRKT
jgi:integrase